LHTVALVEELKIALAQMVSADARVSADVYVVPGEQDPP
jgi:hypothetical protein